MRDRRSEQEEAVGGGGARAEEQSAAEQRCVSASGCPTTRMRVGTMEIKGMMHPVTALLTASTVMFGSRPNLRWISVAEWTQAIMEDPFEGEAAEGQ
eukprot:2085699-Rhodomonas_salina.1